jgi:hypothetical protein
MVPVDELWRLKRQRPFRPFRVHLQDGRVFEARYPNLILISGWALTIGYPIPGDPDPDPLADKMESMPFDYITKVELVQEPAAREGT